MIGMLVLVLLFAGILMIVSNELAYDRPQKVTYRYLPRDLEEYLRTAPPVSTLYGSMFTEKDVLRA
jgi:hypothetical protein